MKILSPKRRNWKKSKSSGMKDKCLSRISFHINQNSYILARYTPPIHFLNSNIFWMSVPIFCSIRKIWTLLSVPSLNSRNSFFHIFFWHFQICRKMAAFVSHRVLGNMAWKMAKMSRNLKIDIINDVISMPWFFEYAMFFMSIRRVSGCPARIS